MVPLYRLTGEKCNFCTYSVSGAPNGPPYMLTGKKCNFRTYIVSDTPNYTIYIGWLRKSAISAPTLLLVLSDCWDCHILAPLYNWATKCSTVKADCWNCHINYWPKFTILPLNGPLYSLIVEIASVWPHFTTGPPKGPPYRLIVEMFTFWPHFVNGPHSGWLLKSFWS